VGDETPKPSEQAQPDAEPLPTEPDPRLAQVLEESDTSDALHMREDANSG